MAEWKAKFTAGEFKIKKQIDRTKLKDILSGILVQLHSNTNFIV